MTSEPQFVGTKHAWLRALVWDLIRVAHPSISGFEVRTAIVDDQLGCQVAATAGELLQTCIRLRVPRMEFCGAIYAR